MIFTFSVAYYLMRLSWHVGVRHASCDGMVQCETPCWRATITVTDRRHWHWQQRASQTCSPSIDDSTAPFSSATLHYAPLWSALLCSAMTKIQRPATVTGRPLAVNVTTRPSDWQSVVLTSDNRVAMSSTAICRPSSGVFRIIRRGGDERVECPLPTGGGVCGGAVPILPHTSTLHRTYCQYIGNSPCRQQRSHWHWMTRQHVSRRWICGFRFSICGLVDQTHITTQWYSLMFVSSHRL